MSDSKSNLNPTISVDLQLAAPEDAAFVFIPFELLTPTGNAVVETDRIFVFGYSNGTNGYLAPCVECVTDGYEISEAAHWYGLRFRGAKKTEIDKRLRFGNALGDNQISTVFMNGFSMRAQGRKYPLGGDTESAQANPKQWFSFFKRFVTIERIIMWLGEKLKKKLFSFWFRMFAYGRAASIRLRRNQRRFLLLHERNDRIYETE